MDPGQNTPINLPPINQSEEESTEQQAQALVATSPFSGASQSQQQDGTNKVPAVDTPQVADDVDLIEKEWVSKVKEIIEKTINDPYEQSRQLTLLKADYLQKRYNKSIKLT